MYNGMTVYETGNCLGKQPGIKDFALKFQIFAGGGP